MKIATYWRNGSLENNPRLVSLLSELRAGGCGISAFEEGREIPGDTDILMSVGGDGTFLSAAVAAAPGHIPVMGVNLGRLGFLSENRPEDVASALLSGRYSIEKRTMLQGSFSSATGNPRIDNNPLALNEITVHRSGAAMLGVDVRVDGAALPTYWADGLLVATSSGSTAYSLSVGGPIVLPESKVLIIAPIASHNMNVRPLIVPNSSVIEIGFKARDEKVLLTMDNRTVEIGRETTLSVSMAQFSLKRVRLDSSSFINALVDKLFWGEDIRNFAE